MSDFGSLLTGFETALTLYHVTLMVVGVMLGILVGVLPGLGAPERRHSAAAADLLDAAGQRHHPAVVDVLGCPVRRLDHVDPVQHPGRAVLRGDHLRRSPDGAARRATEALATAFLAAGFGALAGVVVVTLIANGIAGFALRFSAPEYFAVYLLAFCSFIGMGGGNPLKTLASLLIGLSLAAVGMDTVSGEMRLTFGFDALIKGISFLVAVIGLFGIGELLVTIEERLHFEGIRTRVDPRIVMRTLIDLPRHWLALLRSTAIGCWMGITPGGPTAASFMAYGIARRFSPRREKFGTGEPGRGVARGGGPCRRRLRAAADAGAWRARLGDRGGDDGRADGLGPAARADAVHGSARLRVGPDRLDVPRQRRRRRAGADDRAAVRGDPAHPVRDHRPGDLRRLPDRRLQVSSSSLDVLFALGFGIVGYVFKKLDFPIAPLVLAMVLGDKTEDAFRQAMILGDGSLGVFWGNWLVGTLMTLALALAAWPVLHTAWSLYAARRAASHTGTRP